MRLMITMELDNAAFTDGGADEVGRILASVAERIPDPLRATDGDLSLHDANGNHCGRARIDDGEDERLKALRGVLSHNKSLKEPFKISPSLIRQIENAVLRD